MSWSSGGLIFDRVADALIAADADRGWADARERQDDATTWAQTARRFHEEWQAAVKRADELSEILASVWLYVSWRYVTRQLTTKQKELWADVIESTGDPDDITTVDRWWRDD